MAFVAESSRFARRERSRSAAGRTVAIGLSLGLSVFLIGGASLTIAAVGAGWMLSRSFEAPGLREALAVVPASTRLSSTGLPEGAARWSVAATIPNGAVYAPMLDPIRAVGLAVRDPEVTGSIPSSFRLASADPASPRRVAIPLRDAGAMLPLPRSRPQLASLTPDIGLPAKPIDPLRQPKTAIYDITARMVYLPNGERLEAHSGLGEYMDDPRNVHLKNRGSTPPNIYSMRLRERLFHGVQAIRLTPVGDGEMYNRDGILAHSYLLGPSGQSNGCISFKDYQRFLDAFLRGEVERVVVVTRLDSVPPAISGPTRSAAAALAPLPATAPARTRSASAMITEQPTLRVW